METGVGFGYKIEWLAVRFRSAESVAASLGLGPLSPATWQDAVAAAYAGAWLLTPPVEGWTLAASIEVRAPDDSRFGPWLARLSASLGEVQYFGTHRVVEYHGWGRANGGVVDRAYAYLGERGEVLFHAGEPTPEEQALGVGFVPDDDWWDSWDEDDDDPWPDEETVLTLAGRWSLDPRTLDGAQLAGSPWIAEPTGRPT
ncbi:hypothetical protein ACGFIR_24380 [Micromonospora sp. NPDC049051]|uniref:hypothetical protein n=1 Tax=Micromonospora sp. NPDC049051 TaxID=3364264 RepID=UPI003712872F